MIPLLAAGIGALGSAAGGAIGGAMASGDKARERELIEQILKDYENIDVPTLQRIVGEALGPSAMEGVQTDPRLRQEQMGVLEKLKSLEEGGGNNAETQAVMHRILSQVGRQEAAGRNAILNNMRARGVAGSGAELAANLSNQQAAAERAQDAGLQEGAAAQRRMLDAMLRRGEMAGSIRRQDFGEKSDAARARDSINRYNADSRSRASYYNAGLPAQQYGMEMQKLAGKAGAARGAATTAAQSAQNTGAMWAGIGNAANDLGAGFAKQLSQQADDDDERDY